MGLSLSKYISDTGFCSRREADRLIEDCRVTINGKDAHKGNRVEPGDTVAVDGEPLKKKKTAVYIALNKPRGITCTTDLQDKSNIIDFMQYKSRIFPIGRLDKLSEGLIFLTNDGDIVNKILRAGNGHEKEYIVDVDKPIHPEFIKKMRAGVRIPGAVTAPCYVKQIGDRKFKIILTQGLNRQIRRMCETLDYRVTALKRIRIMNIQLGGLPVGKWRYFSPAELDVLLDAVKHSRNSLDGDGMGE